MVRALIDAELADFVCGAVAIVAATRDEQLRPQIHRGWGPQVSGDVMTVCLDGAPPAPAAPLAVTCSRPSSYRTVQLKGAVTASGPMTEADRERVAAHVRELVVETTPLGVEAIGRLCADELTTVTFVVAELFEQTPGPLAGTRL